VPAAGGAALPAAEGQLRAPPARVLAVRVPRRPRRQRRQRAVAWLMLPAGRRECAAVTAGLLPVGVAMAVAIAMHLRLLLTAVVAVAVPAAVAVAVRQQAGAARAGCGRRGGLLLVVVRCGESGAEPCPCCQVQRWQQRRGLRQQTPQAAPVARLDEDSVRINLCASPGLYSLPAVSAGCL
jgi:hypothetical protein